MVDRASRQVTRSVPKLVSLVFLLLIASVSLAQQPGQPAPQPPSPPRADPLPPPPSPVPAPTSLPLQARPLPPLHIPPGTSAEKLLPTPPKGRKSSGPIIDNDLARVPEVAFEEALAPSVSRDEARRHTAHTLTRINFLNAKKRDGYLEALLPQRADLSGLPFAMGDACRTTGEQSKLFNRAVSVVRAAFNGPLFQSVPVPPAVTVPPSGTVAAPTTQTAFLPQIPGRSGAAGFWDSYRNLCAEEDKEFLRLDKRQKECVTLARIRALMQILAAEPAEVRLGLVKFLSGVPHAEASRALARLAIYSAEEAIREAALEALKVRRERDYTDVLVSGLRYPWPDVAKRTAEAVVKLERSDLVGELVKVLDESDPRLPKEEMEDGKKVMMVREVVKINHHRNCLLCHAPGNSGKVSPEALSAEVPMPTDPLPSPNEGYRTTTPDLLVRVDVTYLRQDFSLLLPVADAHPWPEMQRFDYLVRKRSLSDSEAAAFNKQLGKREPGEVSKYHRSALAALRELTGKDTEPTAAAWRRVLKLPVD